MDLIKKLTSKDAKDYEPVASQIMDTGNVELFKELIAKDDFLFDFVKENVAKRLEKATNKNNFKNLLKFLDCYSPYYEDFVASTLAQFADDEITAKMKEYLKSGTDNQKTYAAKFFSYVNPEDAKDLLRENAESEFSPLMVNCAKCLSIINDKDFIDKSVQKINSDDDYEVLNAVKFLSAYNDESVLPDLFKTAKKSGMAENISSEIFYLKSPVKFLNTEEEDDMLYCVCTILNGLAEIIPVSTVIDFEFYELFDALIKASPTGASAVTLLLAKEKFLQLTENEEYLFDEDKNTKNEVFDIKNLLSTINQDLLESFMYEELYEESDFVLHALDFAKNKELITPLLESSNQTVILKSVEVLKDLNILTAEEKELALKNVTDENIRAIISAM